MGCCCRCFGLDIYFAGVPVANNILTPNTNSTLQVVHLFILGGGGGVVIVLGLFVVVFNSKKADCHEFCKYIFTKTNIKKIN